jgi:hypothetical protein
VGADVSDLVGWIVPNEGFCGVVVVGREIPELGDGLRVGTELGTCEDLASSSSLFVDDGCDEGSGEPPTGDVVNGDDVEGGSEEANAATLLLSDGDGVEEESTANATDNETTTITKTESTSTPCVHENPRQRTAVPTTVSGASSATSSCSSSDLFSSPSPPSS